MGEPVFLSFQPTVEPAYDQAAVVQPRVAHVALTDDEILEAYKRLASKTGIFVEPASAASVAGILKLSQKGYFKDHKDARIVCTVTGHGLKDPNIAIKNVTDPVVLDADIKTVLNEIGL